MLIPIDTPAIDSFSLTIPKDKIKIIDERFCSRIVVYYCDADDYETDEDNKIIEHPPKPFVYTYNGITLRLTWVNRMDAKREQSEFLQITLSAKLLRERYFQGIQLYNIDYILHEINSLNVIKIAREDFMQGLVSDVDFCLNYRISQDSFIRTNEKIISLARAGFSKFFNFFKKTKTVRNVNKTFDENYQTKLYTNLGLDINSRSNARPSTPYLKNYFKQIELTTKSRDFYLEFLVPELEKRNDTIKNLARIEYTIKGSKHKQRLLKKGLLINNYKTLHDLLCVSNAEMKKIIYSGFHDYINTPKTIARQTDTKGISPTDYLIVNMIKMLIEAGKDTSQILSCVEGLERKQKSRTKSKVEKLINHALKDNLSLKSQDTANKEVNTFFEKIENLGFEQMGIDPEQLPKKPFKK